MNKLYWHITVIPSRHNIIDCIQVWLAYMIVVKIRDDYVHFGRSPSYLHSTHLSLLYLNCTLVEKTKGNKYVRTFVNIRRRKGKLQRSHMIFVGVVKLVY
jgi:hypothetical protein